MRSFRSKSGPLLLAAALVLSLSGCSGLLFTKTVRWSGWYFYNERKHIEVPIDGMFMMLRPDGTGSAEGIPRGNQKTADNICIEVTSEDRYTGDLTWKKVNDYRFEITFPGSRYTVTSGPSKFVPDWAEIRIYTCNWGGEYWSLKD